MPASISAAGLRLRAHPRDPTTIAPQLAKKDESCGFKDIENYASPYGPAEECAGFVKGSSVFDHL
jgi:hypothetical protein